MNGPKGRPNLPVMVTPIGRMLKNRVCFSVCGVYWVGETYPYFNVWRVPSTENMSVFPTAVSKNCP